MNSIVSDDQQFISDCVAAVNHADALDRIYDSVHEISWSEDPDRFQILNNYAHMLIDNNFPLSCGLSFLTGVCETGSQDKIPEAYQKLRDHLWQRAKEDGGFEQADAMLIGL